MTNDLVVHRVLDSLAIKYKQVKVSYATLTKKWCLDKIISECVQRENRMNDRRAKESHMSMIALIEKSNNNNIRFKFQKRNNHGNHQTYTALRILSIKVFRNKELTSSVRKWAISRLIVTSTKQ